MVSVKQLSGGERGRLLRHFIALPQEDIYLRFGSALSAAAIATYVMYLDFERDAIFGVYGENLELIGVAHLAPSGDAAELGISVLRGQRGKGVGCALFQRAIERAGNLELNSLFVHFLAENIVMRHLARKLGLISVTDGNDATAAIALPQPNAGTVWNEWLDDCIALYDYSLKAQVQLLKPPRPQLALDKMMYAVPITKIADVTA
jgi:RimJ/RimL family protein N-acetyltransferase